jgi:hypothetical protein
MTNPTMTSNIMILATSSTLMLVLSWSKPNL